MMKNSFEIASYVGVKPMLFGMGEDQVEMLVGRPIRRTVNNLGEGNAQYEFFSLRYAPTDKTLVEVGFSSSAKVTFNAIDLFGDAEAFQKLVVKDSCPYEYYGFIVLLDLGLALTGFHDNDISQRAVTAFSSGRWDSIKAKFNRFSRV